MTDRYAESRRQLERALRTIPLGAQTFSKSITQYPLGVSPYFAARAKGSRLWDVDGNEYVDFVNALASVNLGYGDSDVNDAVRAQLDDGVIFSLSHPLEAEVAELLVELIPCAEMVRFGKNGSDATAGAVRVARAFTGRDRVAVCGYHGWQDWYIGTTARNLGVPEAVRALSHSFPYADLPALDALFSAHPGEFAAVILEPMNVREPPPGYLDGVKTLAHKHGALLVFDETITGFRFHLGGAQALFGVTPDLATFGKGIANGFPLSAVVGRADVMKLMEEVFFSFTMGGETLSLAAAAATLRKVRDRRVPEHLAAHGERLRDALIATIARHGLSDTLSVSGHPSWTFLLVRDAANADQFQIKTLLLQEMLARGYLTLGTHNLSFAHNQADIAGLIAAYDETFALLAAAFAKGDIATRLRAPALRPLFKVR